MVKLQHQEPYKSAVACGCTTVLGPGITGSKNTAYFPGISESFWPEQTRRIVTTIAIGPNSIDLLTRQPSTVYRLTYMLFVEPILRIIHGYRRTYRVRMEGA